MIKVGLPSAQVSTHGYCFRHPFGFRNHEFNLLHVPELELVMKTVAVGWCTVQIC